MINFAIVLSAICFICILWLAYWLDNTRKDFRLDSKLANDLMETKLKNISDDMKSIRLSLAGKYDSSYEMQRSLESKISVAMMDKFQTFSSQYSESLTTSGHQIKELTQRIEELEAYIAYVKEQAIALRTAKQDMIKKAMHRAAR